MAAQIDVSKVNVLADLGAPQNAAAVSKVGIYADTGVPANAIGVSKVGIYADTGVPANAIGVSKVVVYAILRSGAPTVRRKTGVFATMAHP